MTDSRATDAMEFQRHRGVLFGVAYRMLGSASDAEDIVQEAWLRRAATDADVADERAFLVRVVTRLCLDELRSARVRRAAYVGPWLPEPVLTDRPEADPFAATERREELSLGAVALLERLSAAERGALILREALELPYDQIAETLQVTPDNARQLAHRARTRVADGRARYPYDRAQHRRLVTALAQLAETGDMETLVDLLSADVTFVSDGGGKVTAARRPIVGHRKVFAFLAGILAKAPAGLRAEVRTLNGRPGVVVFVDTEAGAELFLVADVVPDADGRIAELLFVLNPDKLAGVRSDLSGM